MSRDVTLTIRPRDHAAERDKWIRLFNRLQGAVQHHQNAKHDRELFVDEVDQALYAAMARVLRDAATKPAA